MTRVLSATLIAVLGVTFICMAGAQAQAPRSDDPVSIWSSRTGLSPEPAEFPPAQPENEVGANDLQKPRWQSRTSSADGILICEPAR